MKDTFARPNTIQCFTLYCYKKYVSKNGNPLLKCMFTSYDREKKVASEPIFLTVICTKDTRIDCELTEKKRIKVDGTMKVSDNIHQDGTKTAELVIFGNYIREA